MSQYPRRPSPLEQQLAQIDWKRYGPLVPVVILLFVLLIGVFTSFYTVQPEGQAVVKRFGRVIAIKDPGLHFKLPFGIDEAIFVPTQRVLKEEFGFRTVQGGTRTSFEKSRAHLDESLMLTGDLKVIDVEWVVQYRIADPDKWLHRVKTREGTIRDISEAVMRRIVGNSLGSDVLTEKRVQVATQARIELQEILNSFDLGIQISTIELQDVTPPESVKPAFNEVNQAEQERERMINEAEKRRNQVIPRAEGQAKQLIAESEGYAFERVNRARGEAERFRAILAEYQASPDVTRRRFYLEMIDAVLPRIGRIIVVDEDSTSPIPLLNLGDGAIASPAPARPAAPQGGARR